MTRQKSPPAPVTLLQREIEAACFLKTASEYAEQIRTGACSRITLKFEDKKRKPGALNLSQDTITLDMQQGRIVREPPPPPLTIAAATKLIDKKVPAILAARNVVKAV